MVQNHQVLPAADDSAVRSWLAEQGLHVEDGRRLVGGLTTLTEALSIAHQDGPPLGGGASPLSTASTRSRIFERPPSGSRIGPVHRHLHPGNVLFDRDPNVRNRLTGIVDWGNATSGPIEIDVSRYRAEVAMVAGALDRITATFQSLGSAVTAAEMEVSMDRLIVDAES